MDTAGIGSLRTLVGALLLAWGVAAPAGAQFLTYHGTPGEGGACDDPLGAPLSVAVGAPGTVNLCIVNDDTSPSSSDPAMVCDAGTGSEVCSVLVTVSALGMTIDDFSASGGVADEFNITGSGSTLSVIASDVSGFTGRTLLGTISVTGDAPGGMLEAVSQWYGASLAAGETVEDAVVLASIGGSCGDGTLNSPPETCDDGIGVAGDGCFQCQDELYTRVSGTAQGGPVEFDFGASGGPAVTVTTLSGQPASLTVDLLVSGINANPAFSASGIGLVERPSFPQTIVTTADATITNGDAGLMFIPEPGPWLQLATALATLGILAALRRR